MATIQYSTASFRPRIDPDRLDDVAAILERFTFAPGPMDELTVDITESGDHPVLAVYGYAPFEAADRAAVTAFVRDERADEFDTPGELDALVEDLLVEFWGRHTDAFLDAIAPSLVADPLIVQTVGFTTCRFPHVASQDGVTPDGTTQFSSLSAQPFQQADSR